MRTAGLGRAVLASGFIALGILTLVYGDFALQWQPVPAGIPGRAALAYVSGMFLVTAGIGALFERSVAVSSRVLIVYLLLWWPLLIPRIVANPLMEARWLGLGENSVLLAGGWVLFATYGAREGGLVRRLTGERGARLARILVGLGLIPTGLSHLVYVQQSLTFVPTWLPYRTAWVWATGIGHIAAGLGVLFAVLPRLAAAMEAGMITAFTLLVWVPRVVAEPTRGNWTPLIISWVIGAGAWVVADAYAGTPWFPRRR